MLEEAEAWIRERLDAGCDLAIERIAVTEEDHADAAVPHLPVNRNDARAAEFRGRHGDEVVELEALPPEGLQRRLRQAIEGNRDADAWKKALQKERQDLRQF